MVTNMNEIKRVAKTLLHTTVHFNEDFAFIAHHPFFQNSFYPIQDVNGMRLLDLNNNEELETARAHVAMLIEDTRDVFDVFMLLNKPYLPVFFKFAHRYMSEEDYARFLSEMWVLVEFPNSDKDVTPLQFVDFFKGGNKKIMMSDEEFQSYRRLPDTVRIYRGICKGAKIRALSWTTDIETARWFANRWNSKGKVYSAEISKRDILAFFSTRGESETVVDFRKLQNIQEI